MLLLAAHVRHALLWPSLPLPWDSSVPQQTNPGTSSPTLIRCPLVCGVIFIFIWLILVLFLSLLCRPTHPYLLLPHLIFCDSESAYSFYFYLPLCLLLGYGLCTRPAPNMYVYKHLVRATLPPSTLFADRVLLHRGYSISEPNAWGETVSKPLGLTLGLVYNLSRLQLTRWSLHSIAKWEWHRRRCWPWGALQAIKRWVGCRSAVWIGRGWVGRERGGVLKVLAVDETSS